MRCRRFASAWWAVQQQVRHCTGPDNAQQAFYAIALRRKVFELCWPVLFHKQVVDVVGFRAVDVERHVVVCFLNTHTQQQQQQQQQHRFQPTCFAQHQTATTCPGNQIISC
jgi:hypothetical protein